MKGCDRACQEGGKEEGDNIPCLQPPRFLQGLGLPASYEAAVRPDQGGVVAVALYNDTGTLDNNLCSGSHLACSGTAVCREPVPGCDGLYWLDRVPHISLMSGSPLVVSHFAVIPARS